MDEPEYDPLVDAVNSALQEMERVVSLPEEHLPSADEEHAPPVGEQSPAQPAAPTIDVDAIRAECAAEVQQQLAEKDHLIEALTARLEQAAEQLDRLQRSGANRTVRGAAGLPPELIEDHRTAVEDLKQVISRWEDLQAAATWGRLETQIAELRELIAQGIAPASHDKPSPTAPAKPAAGGGSWWEAQKASLLGEAPPAAPAAQTHQAPVTSYVPPDGPLDVPESPPPVDLDGISLDEARQAIRDRDRVIAQLRDPLLIAQAATEFGGELPTSLDALPEPLRDRLAKLETEWQAKFRQAELSLSLERARIGREENAVRLQQEQLRKELIKLGVTADRVVEPSRDKATEPAAPDYASRRTWFGFPKVTRKPGE